MVHPKQAARTASVVRKADAAKDAAAATAARGAAWEAGDTAGRGLRLVHGGPVAAALGKIFFTLGGSDFVCSGALVRSKHAYVVLTAAHCVDAAKIDRTSAQIRPIRAAAKSGFVGHRQESRTPTRASLSLHPPP